MGKIMGKMGKCLSFTYSGDTLQGLIPTIAGGVSHAGRPETSAMADLTTKTLNLMAELNGIVRSPT
jgi:hypothetical protein